MFTRDITESWLIAAGCCEGQCPIQVYTNSGKINPLRTTKWDCSDATCSSQSLKLLGIRLGSDKQEAGNSIFAVFPYLFLWESTCWCQRANSARWTVWLSRHLCVATQAYLWNKLWSHWWHAYGGGLLCVWDVHTCLWYWINRWSIMHLGVGVSLLIHFASRLCYRQLWAKSQLTSAALVTYLAFYHEGEGHSAQPRARVQLILLLGVLLSEVKKMQEVI